MTGGSSPQLELTSAEHRRRYAEQRTADSQLPVFAAFIELERRVRHLEDELGFSFFVVNETFNLVRYRQALLWRVRRIGTKKGAIQSVSGLTAADPSAPFVQWANRLCQHLAAAGVAEDVREVTVADLPADVADQWAHWLPEQLVWLALRNRQGELLGGLLLAREDPYSTAEQSLLGYLADAYGHAWGALRRSFRLARGLRLAPSLWYLAFFVVLVALGLIPVYQTALAPAELIAVDPDLVRAPIDGVVDRFEVLPNAFVRQGDVLLHLDTTKLDSRLKVAQKALDVSAAELRQAEQKALIDEGERVNLVILQGRVRQQAAEVEYVLTLLDRSQVRAPSDGLAVFDNVQEWMGRPVTLGEKILMVADPSTTEIEVFLPVADAIAMTPGARVRMFLNTAPHNPVEARLRYASYEASATPEGYFAYRLLASIDDLSGGFRIGLKGTAKVYGERTILGVYLLRKPIVALRQTLGI